MKVVPLNPQPLHLCIAHFLPQRVLLVIKHGIDLQAGFRTGRGNEIDNHLVTRQRATLPVDTDKREQAVFDLVPFASPRRKVTDGDRQPTVVRESLQLFFPQPQPIAVAAPRIRRDQQPRGAAVPRVPQLLPPAPDAGHGKFPSVVGDPDIDVAPVRADLVNSIRHGLPQPGVGKIVEVDLKGFAGGQPPPPGILEVADQFFLLGIDRKDRGAAGQKLFGTLTDVVELGVPIRMLGSFAGLAIGLQPVPLLGQQRGHRPIGDRVLAVGQLGGQGASTFVRPLQRRVRLAARGIGHQVPQVAQDRWVGCRELLPPAAFLPEPRAGQCQTGLQLSEPRRNGLAVEPRSLMRQFDAPVAEQFGIGGHHQAPGAFIQDRQQLGILLSIGGKCIHTPRSLAQLTRVQEVIF